MPDFIDRCLGIYPDLTVEEKADLDRYYKQVCRPYIEFAAELNDRLNEIEAGLIRLKDGDVIVDQSGNGHDMIVEDARKCAD
jgi:hypothetical protein